MRNTAAEKLLSTASGNGWTIGEQAFADYMDQTDPLRAHAAYFHAPVSSDGIGGAKYFSSHLMGLQHRGVEAEVLKELQKWRLGASEAYFNPSNPWIAISNALSTPMAALVGAQAHEVALMNTMTVNLHLLLVAFFKPSGKRVRIMTDSHRSSSVVHAIRSALKSRGLTNAEDEYLLFVRDKMQQKRSPPGTASAMGTSLTNDTNQGTPLLNATGSASNFSNVPAMAIAATTAPSELASTFLQPQQLQQPLQPLTLQVPEGTGMPASESTQTHHNGVALPGVVGPSLDHSGSSLASPPNKEFADSFQPKSVLFGATIIPPAEYVQVVERHAEEVAVLVLTAVHDFSGQLHDVAAITALAKSKGIVVLLDASHAVGNVPLALHDWRVDAAFWTTTKYLCGGPANVGGIFVHAAHTASGASLMPLGGFSAVESRNPFTAFGLPHRADGAAIFQVSHPTALGMASLAPAIELLADIGMPAVREKSLLLTAYLELLLHERLDRASIEIVTPANPSQRGAQLTIRLQARKIETLEDDPVALLMQSEENIDHASAVHAHLMQRGLMCDYRPPDLLRFSPSALYNSFSDVLMLTQALSEVLV